MVKARGLRTWPPAPTLPKKGIDQSLRTSRQKIGRACQADLRFQRHRPRWAPSPPATTRSRPDDRRCYAKLALRNGISLEEGHSMTTGTARSPRACASTRATSSPYFPPTRADGAISRKPLHLATTKKIGLDALVACARADCPHPDSPCCIIANSRRKALPPWWSQRLARCAQSGLPFKAPGFGDRRKPCSTHIAVSPMVSWITRTPGLKLETPSWRMLGTARPHHHHKDTPTIRGRWQRSAVNAVEQDSARRSTNRLHLRQREAPGTAGKLSGGVAVVNVGAATETEMKDKKLRLDRCHSTPPRRLV